jgi:hypothetical protein
MRRDGGFSGDEDGDGWSPQADISAFSKLLFEIVAGHPFPRPPSPPSAAEAEGEGEADAEGDGAVILPPDVPEFVSVLIEGGLRPMGGRELSFVAIIETLEANDFRIVSGVDSAAVSEFVSAIESAM